MLYFQTSPQWANKSWLTSKLFVVECC